MFNNTSIFENKSIAASTALPTKNSSADTDENVV